MRPRVKEIIIEYEQSGITGVIKYLTQPDMVIEQNTWAANLIKDIKEEHINTAISNIELIYYKFKLNHDREDVEPEK